MPAARAIIGSCSARPEPELERDRTRRIGSSLMGTPRIGAVSRWDASKLGRYTGALAEREPYHDAPPPLVGLGREADQGWGEGFSNTALRLDPCGHQPPSKSSPLPAHLLVQMHTELLQLAMQRAAFHADELRGAADIAAKPRQLRLKILRLEQVAR